MSKDNVIALIQPGEFTDQLTDMLREGSQRLILQAVEAEFASFLDKYAPERLADGRQRVVRHGHLPERKITTGIGAVRVSVPRSRDRRSSPNKAAQSQDFSIQGKQGADDKIRFVSQLLPPYVRRSKSVEMALPYLYLKGEYLLATFVR
mgnify:CR=1 FL=1